MTSAELCLWQCLRGGSLGVRFRRQVVIGRYIVDFACLSKRLVIELDGESHGEKIRQEEDRLRDAALVAKGYRVLRFWNFEILETRDAVMARIREAMSPPS